MIGGGRSPYTYSMMYYESSRLGDVFGRQRSGGREEEMAGEAI